MNGGQKIAEVSVSEKPYGKTKDGRHVTYYELTNESGMTVGIINYGRIITKIMVPDRNETLGDVVLGHDNILAYEEKSDFFGCIAGRYANRIGNGTFTLDGEGYQLPKNDNGNSLHGGINGFDKQIWSGNSFKKGSEVGVILSHLNPGELDCRVTYTLNSKNELRIDYEAATNKTTVLNLSNHSYFNLKDGGASSILDHQLKLESSEYTPVNEGLIATGEIRSVENTPFDFRQSKIMGTEINKADEQLKFGLGYDHNYVLDNEDGKLSLAAKVIEPTTGRILEVFTTEPGIQFYSGNFLNGNITGKNNISYQHRSGFCLETQHFPATVLSPDEKYETVTVFRFRTEQKKWFYESHN
jgi:aldose 1-epimerase